MERLRIGDPLDKAIDIGAIVGPVQLEQIRPTGQTGRERGRDPLADRRGLAPPRAAFYPPTLFTNVSARRRPSHRQRYSAPSCVAMTFRTPAEAVALANNTRYGLAASVSGPTTSTWRLT